MKSNTLHIVSSKATNNTIWIYRWGWYNLVASVIFFLLFISMVIVYILTPPVIIAVDNEGRIQESIEYLSVENRSEEEVTIAVKHFLSAKMSLNRDTIFIDMTTALNMMSHELMEKELQIIKKQQMIERIQNSNQRSYLTFSKTEMKSRNDRIFIVECDGMLTLGKNTFPFKVRVHGKIVPRSHVNSFGIIIEDYEDIG